MRQHLRPINAQVIARRLRRIAAVGARDHDRPGDQRPGIARPRDLHRQAAKVRASIDLLHRRAADDARARRQRRAQHRPARQRVAHPLDRAPGCAMQPETRRSPAPRPASARAPPPPGPAWRKGWLPTASWRAGRRPASAHQTAAPDRRHAGPPVARQSSRDERRPGRGSPSARPAVDPVQERAQIGKDGQASHIAPREMALMGNISRLRPGIGICQVAHPKARLASHPNEVPDDPDRPAAMPATDRARAAPAAALAAGCGASALSRRLSARHAGLLRRMGDYANHAVLIDPTDLPFVLRLEPAAGPRLTAHRRGAAACGCRTDRGAAIGADRNAAWAL